MLCVQKITNVFECHTTALGSTQPPTAMSTRNIYLGGKDGRCVAPTNSPPKCANYLEI